MENYVVEFFQQYAHSPWLVYSAIWGFMLLSAFGLPIPEEVVLISAGLIGNSALSFNEPNSSPLEIVNVYVLSGVAFLAVISSDSLIYGLGRRFGPKLFKMRWFNRMVSDQSLERIQTLSRKYGYWAVVIFRFTPGVRFPGHLMCGAMGLSLGRFLLIDALAAGISVPTQVLLVSFHGKAILKVFMDVKFYVLTTAAIAAVIYFSLRYLRQRRSRAGAIPPSQQPETRA